MPQDPKEKAGYTSIQM
nr:unnamed protein product [Callosobruchus analis]